MHTCSPPVSENMTSSLKGAGKWATCMNRKVLAGEIKKKNPWKEV